MIVPSNLNKTEIIAGYSWTISCCLSFSVSQNNSQIFFGYYVYNCIPSPCSSKDPFLAGLGHYPLVVYFDSKGDIVHTFFGAYKLTEETFHLNQGSYKIGLGYYPDGDTVDHMNFSVYLQVQVPKYII